MRGWLLLKSLALVGALTLCGPARAQLAVSSTSPGLNALNVVRNAAISVTFDRGVNIATLTRAHFCAFGKVSGTIRGSVAFSNGNQTVTLTPTRPFIACATVMGLMSTACRTGVRFDRKTSVQDNAAFQSHWFGGC